jgi:hypothetical protein
VPVNDRLPWRRPNAGADTGSGGSSADSRGARLLIAVLLLATAALDMTRCGLVMATARHPAVADGLFAAWLVAATVSIWIARACLGRRRWPIWAALLIGAASAPEAAVSGFDAPYTIPDTATVAIGILLAVAILATVGPTGPEQPAVNRCARHRDHPMTSRPMKGQDPRHVARPLLASQAGLTRAGAVSRSDAPSDRRNPYQPRES